MKVFPVILVKLGFIALVLVVPSGLPLLVAGHGVALLVLLVAVAVTLLAYKLRGVTRYGWRKQQEERRNKGIG